MTVNVIENIRIAIFSIKSNAMRAFLTMLGIIIGVASVIAIITIGNSGKSYIVKLINDVGGNSVNITVNTQKSNASDAITDDDIQALRDNDTIEYVSPMTTEFANFEAKESSGFGVAIGANEELEKILNAKMTYGRFFSKYEYDAQRNVAVIDSQTAKAFFGTENVVGKTIDMMINKTTINFKIVGVCYLKIAEAMGDSNSVTTMMESFGVLGENKVFAKLYIPSSVLIQTSNSTSYTNCYLTSAPGENLDKAGQVAVNMLSARHNNIGRNIYSATNMSTLVELLDAVINIFTLFISSVGAISLVVGGIGVMNIMLVSVTERTREIGIRKALGARTGTILKQFLTESVIICLIGGALGMVLGLTISYSVSLYMNVPIRLQFSTILVAIGFSSIIGIISGIYPARKAAKMPPIEALRRD